MLIGLAAGGEGPLPPADPPYVLLQQDRLSDTLSGGIPPPPPDGVDGWVHGRRAFDAGLTGAPPLIAQTPVFHYADVDISRLFGNNGGIDAIRPDPAFAGAVIDVQPGAMPFDPLWDGHEQTDSDQAGQTGRARQAGRRLGQGLWSEGGFPTIAVGAAPDQVAPLWWPFFAGLAEELAARPAASLHLLMPAALHQAHGPRLLEQFDGIRRMLKLHMPAAAMRAWEERGSLGVMLDLGGDQAQAPYVDAYEPPDNLLSAAQKTALITAKAVSEEYLLCVNPPRIPPTPGTDGPTLPRRPFDAPQSPLRLDFRTPLDEYDRIGPAGLDGEPAMIFWSPEGAAALLWDGAETPLSFTDRRRSVPVHTLVLDEIRYEQPSNGAVTIEPAAGPILLERLDAPRYAWPALLWHEWEREPGLRGQEMAVTFGFANRTGLRMQGVLSLLPGEERSAHPDNAPVNVAAGADTIVTGSVRGAFRLGEPVEGRLVFVPQGGGMVQRSFVFHPEPYQSWRRLLAAPIAAPPIRRSPSDGGDEIVVASTGGEIMALDPMGDPRWRHAVSGRFFAPLTEGRDSRGGSLLAGVDHRGRVHAFDAGGARTWTSRAGPGGREARIAAARLHGYPGAEFVVTTPGYGVTALTSAGQHLWEVLDMGEQLWSIAIEPQSEDLGALLVVSSQEDGVMYMLDGLGDVLWESALPAPPSAPPVTRSPDSGEPDTVLVGLRDGRIWEGGLDGGGVAIHETGADEPIRAVAVVPPVPGSPLRCAVTTPSGVTGLGEDLEPLWRQPLRGAGPATVWRYGGHNYLAVTTPRGIVALGPDGRVAWRDERAAATPADSVLPVPIRGADTDNLVYTAADHTVRSLAPQR